MSSAAVTFLSKTSPPYILFRKPESAFSQGTRLILRHFTSCKRQTCRQIQCYKAEPHTDVQGTAVIGPSPSQKASDRAARARLVDAQSPLKDNQARQWHQREASEMDEDADIAQVLFSKELIHERVAELGRSISADFAGKQVVLVGVATGGFMFLADLVRAVSIPVNIDLLRAQSYGSGTSSSGAVALSCDLKINVRDKHVILVEDIIDTGHTFVCLLQHLAAKGPASVSYCTLLNKSARREAVVQLGEGGRQYVGFECPDEFVVGYGLDFDERYRSLPYVGILNPSVFAKA